MNRKVSVAEAKNKLPAIIHDVKKGSVVEITRYGRSVAFVVPQKDYEWMQEKGGGFWEALVKVRNIMQAEGIVMEDRDFSNLRDASPGRSIWIE
jgi:antitoxin Phd